MSPCLRFNQLAGMLITLLAVFVCAVFAPDPCYTINTRYEHGADITTAIIENFCHRVSCDDGAFIATREGCLDTTVSPHICRSQDDVFTHACITYTCTPQNSLIWTSALCLDANGNCRQPGTTFSRWTRLGEFSNNCTCVVYPGVDVVYTCYFDY
ncbi:hypothetical protein BsWGS_03416 [Bradybaena similaris]